ncbi:MAG: hypothetical protein V4623_08320, partial [Pseudomonadota bacterium]
PRQRLPHNTQTADGIEFGDSPITPSTSASLSVIQNSCASLLSQRHGKPEKPSCLTMGAAPALAPRRG